jgi:hypothetical protein
VRRTTVHGTLLALVAVMAGCAQIEKEGRTVDELVVRMQSDDFAQRQGATAEILGRESESLRYIVIPRLALESARVPLELSSTAGNVLIGRVTGGDGQNLEIEVTERVGQGAVVLVPFGSIKVIRLFSP